MEYGLDEFVRDFPCLPFTDLNGLPCPVCGKTFCGERQLDTRLFRLIFVQGECIGWEDLRCGHRHIRRSCSPEVECYCGSPDPHA